MYDATLIVNSKNEKFFVYKQKLIPNMTEKCEFIGDIDPQYNSFLLPFMLLAPIGLGAFAQCFCGGISCELETKDDLSRPPVSSTSGTSYEKIGEIHTYCGNHLIKTKDLNGYVNTVRNVYHQIPKTGKEYFWSIWL
jgi:hypothetical protein